jgi:hypothetical protein
MLSGRRRQSCLKGTSVIDGNCDNRRSLAACQPPNKQLQRTVERDRGDAARASFHYARASRFTRQHAAAELRR